METERAQSPTTSLRKSGSGSSDTVGIEAVSIYTPIDLDVDATLQEIVAERGVGSTGEG